jgi:hypothetical protein
MSKYIGKNNKSCSYCETGVIKGDYAQTCGKQECRTKARNEPGTGAKKKDAPLIFEQQVPFEQKLLEVLKKNTLTVVELADHFDRAPRVIKEVVGSLRSKGFLVEVRQDEKIGVETSVRPGAENPVIVHNLVDYENQVKVFGVTSDNHLGSKHERLDVLNALYDLYEAEGVTEVFNAGNWIEGEARFNKHDIKVFGMDRQVDYFCENYPQRKGITTFFVAGDDHEGWYQQREQVEIGRYTMLRAQQGGREDLVYKGYVECDIELKTAEGSSWMKLMHPGGGSAYALSYSAQKLVESFQGGEKPAVLLYGHYHKFDYCYAREVHCIGSGCTCDQSVFMRKNKIQAHVGGLMVKINQAPAGHINRCQVEWLPFYDRSFYNKRSYIGGSDN